MYDPLHVSALVLSVRIAKSPAALYSMPADHSLHIEQNTISVPNSRHCKNTDVASNNLTGPGFAWSRSISVILSWYLPWDERISTVINTKIRIFLNGRSQPRINGVLKSSFLESRTPVTHRFNDTVDVLFRCITIYIKNNRLYGFYQFPLMYLSSSSALISSRHRLTTDFRIAGWFPWKHSLLIEK